MWKKIGVAGVLCLAGLAQAQEQKMSCDELRQGTSFDAAQLEQRLGALTSDSLKWSFEGLMRICGVGLPADFGAGLALVERAAQAGSEDAFAILWLGYGMGQLGFPRDTQIALKWLRLAAEKGKPELQMMLGQVLLAGGSGSVDRINGERWLTKAASSGHGPAMSALGGMYFTSKRYDLALPWLRLAAAGGSAEAYAMLAKAYRGGWGVPVDESQAFHWAQLAVNEQLPEGYFIMGELAEAKKGGYAEAVKWYQQASDMGVLAAQRALVRAKRESESDSQQEIRLRNMAKDGTTKSLLDLARYLAWRKNSEALIWYRAAADRGSLVAMEYLGETYVHGLLGTSDVAEGVRWHVIAADHGSLRAKFWLSRSYLAGKIVPRNLVVAYAVDFVAQVDPDDAERKFPGFRPAFDDALTAVELEKAQQLARELIRPGNFQKALELAVAQ